jgi:hypothetical protein
MHFCGLFLLTMIHETTQFLYSMPRFKEYLMLLNSIEHLPRIICQFEQPFFLFLKRRITLAAVEQPFICLSILVMPI